MREFTIIRLPNDPHEFYATCTIKSAGATALVSDYDIKIAVAESFPGTTRLSDIATLDYVGNGVTRVRTHAQTFLVVEKTFATERGVGIGVTGRT